MSENAVNDAENNFETDGTPKAKPCPSCGQSLAYNASKCPGCGYVTTTGKVMHWTSPGMIVLIVIALLIGLAVAQN